MLKHDLVRVKHMRDGAEEIQNLSRARQEMTWSMTGC